jgi:hypothetical protein
VATSEGNWGIWLLDGGTLHTIPRLDSNYHVGGWSADGGSVFAFPTRQSGKTENMYRVNVLTGKMELVKTFGQDLAPGTVSIGVSYLSGDGGAYAYSYMQTLSQVYVVRGLK